VHQKGKRPEGNFTRAGISGKLVRGGGTSYEMETFLEHWMGGITKTVF